MNVSFHGAAREVTGSCHLIEHDGSKILLDCGMIQGGKERHKRNRDPFGFDPAELDAVLLSHAHIDHSGRLPLLLKSGFKGPVLTTEPSAELCRILLTDSGRIHEEDARWKITRLQRRGEDASWVRPLFSEEDALEVLDRLKPVPFGRPIDLGGVGIARFVMAGHILGAAIVELELGDGSARRSLVFSGDLGVGGARLLSRPQAVGCPDFLLIESTYGNRDRDEGGDRTELLYNVIRKTAGRGGRVIIPSFAVGRTQEILARINDLVESGRLSGIPVYVDSPMAVTATQVFALHPEAYSDDARRKLHAGDAPLAFDGLRLITDVQESIALNKSRGPAVIISASGMCTAGRIKHHLKHHISESRNTVLFVGYQAVGTLGRIIRSGAPTVRIFGDWYPVRAEVEAIEGFSAHADQKELIEWFEALEGTPRCTYVVHGEERSALAFAAILRERCGARVEVPQLGQRFELE